ncbi:RFA1 [Candida pseudojiufengensis]|uniref:RFA1 n=1 Tax=Candida pseudojiufengensis TaxID=497109 RepID=UPI0022248626|nr:RFA1 [Candida pseudojiufengensis]KAI5960595.1 RFA1 [Candida pseudojiufengensis]
MAPVQLSNGVLRKIFSKDTYEQVPGPITLQITNMKALNVNDESKKYRVIVSDGVYSCHGIIDETCTQYLENNNCTRYSYIQVNDFRATVHIKYFLVVKELEVVSTYGEKPTNTLIAVDTYFTNHPEEAYELVQPREGREESEPPVAPTHASTPPVAQSTAQPAIRNPFNSDSTTTTKQAGEPAIRVSPIETLSPYQNNWTIKARISYKGDLRSWSNAKGEGKVLSVNFLDESDEIKASAFNDVAEKVHNLVEEGKVYYISKAKVSAARKKFNNLTHPYELQLDKDTTINECFDESDVPKLNFNFVKLDQIQNLEPNAIIDVLGALKLVKEPFQITAKSTGRAFERRDITIVDETGFAIDVGLWNNTAVDFNIEEGTVIAFKACKVTDFNGRTLGLTQSGSLIPNPGTPESYQLKGWYDSKGVNENYKSLKAETTSAKGLDLAARKTIAEANEECSQLEDKPAFFTIKGTFSYAKPENFAYPACTNQVAGTDSSRPPLNCNKKLVDMGDGRYRCEKCDIEYDEPTWRYILYISVIDQTDQMWLTLFDEHAQKLLGLDANELMKYKNEDSVKVAQIIGRAYCKEYNFRVKARQESYNDTLKTRFQCNGLSELDFNAECDFLCNKLSSI